MLLTIVQIFSLIAVIIASICKDKKNILLWVFIANLSNFLVMLIAQETDGWAGSIATTIRGFLFIYKDKVKTNLLFYIGITLHIVAFIFSYQDIFSFCIIIATMMVCISQWFGNPLQIKIFALLSICMWIIYTIHIGLYLDLPKRIIEGAFLIISIITLIKDNKNEITI